MSPKTPRSIFVIEAALSSVIRAHPTALLSQVTKEIPTNQERHRRWHGRPPASRHGAHD